MKYFILILVFTIFFSATSRLSGQNTDQNKFSIQLNLGVSRTLHYNQPVNLTRCFEGCIPEEQKPRLTPNGNLNIYGHLNKNNSLKIGFGATSYRYWEKGLASDGGGNSFSPYETIEIWGFYGLSVGYRYIFNSSKKIKLFIENDFIYEIPIKDFGILKNGLAIQPNVGGIINISNNWSLIAQTFYKSGVTNYNDSNFGKDYVPNAFGIQLGVNLKI